MAHETKLLGTILDDIGGNGRVVGDLLDEERCLAASILVRPNAIEYLPKDRVKGPGRRQKDSYAI